MKHLSKDRLTATTVSPEEISPEDVPQSLSPSKRAELWSGRLAMVGFMTTVVAIAARATL
ncbi:hypothetical protein XM38_010240 [Halomicronema hongdechloris C2206]|uniref:High light inducible protein n=1 Tax=Halomicronema hongdechloris C2206 TaxID=1641165 RepID=A0A1Z3HIE5_9CYAN|nr:hypothetical protein [Halomicronema hongdechloris]ASC70094.1 hypothetical protein XM38_010240 [Halomicronema hongdechloris C2206]